MKYKVLMSLLAGLCAFHCSAAPKTDAVLGKKLAPPPIVSRWKEVRVKVLETGEFSSMTLPAETKKRKRKTGKKTAPTTADLVTEKGKKFFWKPSPLLSSTLRVADLTGAAISEDGSLVVVAERIGGEGKANSTRLLFFDVQRHRLAGGFVLPEVLISSIAFCRNSQTEIFGIRSRFTPYNVKDGLVRIDLKSKRIIDSLDSPAGAITSFATAGNGKLFFTVSNSPAVYEQDADSFSVVPRRIKSRLSSPRICVMPRILAAYGKEGVELFRMNLGRWIPEEKLHPFTDSFVPVSSRVIDPALPAICFAGAYEEDLWYFRNGKLRKLKERTSGIQVWDQGAMLLIVETASNNRVFIFTMPEGTQMEKAVTPNRLRPANRNGSFAMLKAPALKSKLVQIDNRGNVFLLDYTRPARWKKSIVHITDRTGFR